MLILSLTTAEQLAHGGSRLAQQAILSNPPESQRERLVDLLELPGAQAQVRRA
jgi:hypothetical protein